MSQQGTAEAAASQQLHSKPTKQHDWLRKLVGEWTYEADTAEPGQPPQKVTGTESVRPIGEIWIQAENTGEMPGGTKQATSIMTLGFAPEKQRFVGTWIGTMMTHMWLYDGELDAAGKVLTLNSTGPSMANDGTTSDYQDVLEIKSDDLRTMTARVKRADGTWQPFMTVTSRRKK